MVTFIGLDSLRVINHQDIVKTLSPLQLHGKKNNMNANNVSAFDFVQHPLKVGDTVNVVEGKYNRKAGTIKHINKNILFLHSNMIMENSGIFVVKARSVVLAGSKLKDNTNVATTMLNAAFGGNAGNGGVVGNPSNVEARLKTQMKRGQRDENIGKTIKIKKGGFKGFAGHIISSSDTHYTVELSSKQKQLVLLKTEVNIVGDKEGAFAGAGSAQSGFGGLYPNTPSMVGETPNRGGETPGFTTGSETPVGGRTPSNMTPGREDVFDMWRPSAQDRIDMTAKNTASVSVSSIGTSSSASSSSVWGSSDRNAAVGSSKASSGGWDDDDWGGGSGSTSKNGSSASPKDTSDLNRDYDRDRDKDRDRYRDRDDSSTSRTDRNSRGGQWGGAGGERRDYDRDRDRNPNDRYGPSKSSSASTNGHSSGNATSSGGWDGGWGDNDGWSASKQDRHTTSTSNYGQSSSATSSSANDYYGGGGNARASASASGPIWSDGIDISAWEDDMVVKFTAGVYASLLGIIAGPVRKVNENEMPVQHNIA